MKARTAILFMTKGIKILGRGAIFLNGTIGRELVGLYLILILRRMGKIQVGIACQLVFGIIILSLSMFPPEI